MIDLTQLKIDLEIGAGSQGKVFLARDPVGARYTVKLVLLDDRADRQQIFERAAQFRADLLDPSMVPVLSYGMVSATPPELARQLGKLSKDALVLVMPFVTGVTLDEIVARQALTLEQGVAALAGIAAALSRLPTDVPHGDVRAPNVFVRPSGDVALTDPDLSTPHPDPGDDLRGLAAIASNVARVAKPVTDALAVDQLERLFDEIAAQRATLTASEAAQQFGEIAVLLGAPPGNVTSVLAGLVRDAQHKPAGTQVSSPAGAGGGRRRRASAVAAVVALAAIAGGATWLGSRRIQKGPLTPALPPAGGEGVTVRGDSHGAGGEVVTADSLYDTTGTVHYAEAVHRLGPSEKVAAADGMIEFEFEDSIARIALLSPRKDTLFELRTPPAGGSVYLDAKPGHYYVEQDRDLGGKVQQDLKLVEIDPQHPQRVTTTKEIVNSPRRP